MHHKVFDIEDVIRWSNVPDNDAIEGLMLHASSKYIQGRHPAVLKQKVFQ